MKRIIFFSIILTAILFLFPFAVKACRGQCYSYYDYETGTGPIISCGATESCQATGYDYDGDSNIVGVWQDCLPDANCQAPCEPNCTNPAKTCGENDGCNGTCPTTDIYTCGRCGNPAAGTSCNADNNACTVNDVWTQGATCYCAAGVPKTCPSTTYGSCVGATTCATTGSRSVTSYSCDSSTGNCNSSVGTETCARTTAGNPCTIVNPNDGTCDASGSCMPAAGSPECRAHALNTGYESGRCFGGAFTHNSVDQYCRQPLGYGGGEIIASWAGDYSCLADEICIGCYNCNKPAPTDSATVGSCTVSITTQGWDYTTSPIKGYRYLSNNPNMREVYMDDDRDQTYCSENLKFRNTWGSADTNGKFTITTNNITKHASNILGGGFNFNSTNADCRYRVTNLTTNNANRNLFTGFSLVGSMEGSAGSNDFAIYDAQKDNNAVWEFNMDWCGDGECTADETNAVCPGDCPLAPVDTTPPTTNIKGTNPAGKDISNCDWYKAGTYQVSVQDYDNLGGSGLDACYYEIRNVRDNGVDVKAGTRTCNSSVSFSFTVGPGGDCSAQGKNTAVAFPVGRCEIYVYSKDKATPQNQSQWDFEKYCPDYTPPILQ